MLKATEQILTNHKNWNIFSDYNRMAPPSSTRETFRNHVKFMEAKQQYATEEVRKKFNFWEHIKMEAQHAKARVQRKEHSKQKVYNS